MKYVFSGEKLKELREKKGLSRFRLSHELSVSHTSVANWEEGINKPSINRLEMLTDKLSCSPNSFFVKI